MKSICIFLLLLAMIFTNYYCTPTTKVEENKVAIGDQYHPFSKKAIDEMKDVVLKIDINSADENQLFHVEPYPIDHTTAALVALVGTFELDKERRVTKIYFEIYHQDNVIYPTRVKELKVTREKSKKFFTCLLYTSPSPRDRTRSRMPSSA